MVLSRDWWRHHQHFNSFRPWVNLGSHDPCNWPMTFASSSSSRDKGSTAPPLHNAVNFVLNSVWIASFLNRAANIQSWGGPLLCKTTQDKDSQRFAAAQYVGMHLTKIEEPYVVDCGTSYSAYNYGALRRLGEQLNVLHLMLHNLQYSYV